MEALIDLACLAPSVGLNQPWRLVIVDDDNIRCAIRQNFANCNADVLAAQSAERAALYARLKLAPCARAGRIGWCCPKTFAPNF